MAVLEFLNASIFYPIIYMQYPKWGMAHSLNSSALKACKSTTTPLIDFNIACLTDEFHVHL